MSSEGLTSQFSQTRQMYKKQAISCGMTGSALKNTMEEPAYTVKAKGTKRSSGIRGHRQAQLSSAKYLQYVISPE